MLNARGCRAVIAAGLGNPRGLGPQQIAVPETPARSNLEPTPLEELELVGKVLDLLQDYFYVHDYDPRFFDANEQAAAYFGLPNKESLIDRTLMHVDSHKTQAACPIQVCRRIMNGAHPRPPTTGPIDGPTSPRASFASTTSRSSTPRRASAC